MLSKLLVVEFASVLAGPSLGMFLAELGARVMKIENPSTGGDVTRSWRLPSESDEDDRSAYFSAVNWGKQSIALNIKDEQDRLRALSLVSKADILITSFRPGQAAQYGLDANDLQAQFPRLIMAEISGYGPEDRRPAFDAIIQAESGFTYLNGAKEQGGEKMPVALMDILAAHHIKEGVLLALLDRERTGKGAIVRVDLLSAGLTSLANQASNFLVAGFDPQPMGSAHPNIAPYGEGFDTQDGPIVLAVGNDQQFEALCNVIAWDAPGSYATNPQRVIQREQLNAELRERISSWSREPLLSALQIAGVPAGPIHRVSEALSLPQALALRLDKDGIRGMRTFLGIVGKKRVDLSAPPHFNEHHAEIEASFFKK